jgi:hypothetical protein
MPVLFERPAGDRRAQETTPVSVVVRAARAEPGVKTTVESALTLARTRETGTEVVLVHDCADRTTWEWLLELKRAHPELYLIDFGEPYGNQLARLEGARRAQHPHVCFAGPGADTDALARAIREAVPRSRAIAVLSEGLGAVAGERLVLQSFAPGTPGPAGDAPVGSKAAPRRRRAGLWIGVGCVSAIAVAAVLVLRAQSPTEAVASPGASAVAERDAGTVETAGAAATPDSATAWSLDGPAPPEHAAAGTDAEPARTKPANRTKPAASADATPATVTNAATASQSEATIAAPASSNESRSDKNPPAQSSPPPAEASAPTETAAPEPAPASSEPVEPPATNETTPPIDAGGGQGTPAPPPAPTTPPATPPATPPETPPAAPPSTPPTDPGPGNGNGNGHAYGHTNGNGQGNGNGPKK